MWVSARVASRATRTRTRISTGSGVLTARMHVHVNVHDVLARYPLTLRECASASAGRGMRGLTSVSPSMSMSSSVSHPDWDLQALNDEMEGLIGKFDDCDGNPGSSAMSEPSTLTPPSSTVESTSTQLTPLRDSSNDSVQQSAYARTQRPSSVQKVQIPRGLSNENDNQKPLYTIFDFGERAQSEEFENVVTKNWKDVSALDDLMEELANNSSKGVILLLDGKANLNDLTNAQKKLFHIYKKASPVVLVISSNDSILFDGIDVSFATCVIQGLGAKHGLAAALAGISSVNESVVDNDIHR
jgi:hypothetical protein